MKILQLCKKVPYPLKDGESIAVNALSKALHNLGCSITLLSMNTSKHPVSFTEKPKALSHYRAIHLVEVDNRVRPLPAFFNLFSPDSYHVSRFVSNGFRKQLEKLLREEAFDVIQLETLYLAPYIPLIRRHSEAPIAMRAHNVEHEIWDRITRNTPLSPRKWYLRHLTEKLRRYELAQLKNYDLLIAITERDLRLFGELGYRGKRITTPIGLDKREYEPDYAAFSHPVPSLAFIGSLDWMPNQEGLDWFLESVWPDLHRQWPQLSFHVAGRNSEAWRKQVGLPAVHMHGEVPCAKGFLNQHAVLIVPLRSGSGMRAKILEGMALGRVVITTSLGLEGIEATHGREVLLADTPSEFEAAVRFCLEQPQKLEAMGRRARALVETRYDYQVIARQLHLAYQKILPQARKALRIF
jgi:glycosyltransferase involved in cell wall biosynthesis